MSSFMRMLHLVKESTRWWWSPVYRRHFTWSIPEYQMSETGSFCLDGFVYLFIYLCIYFFTYYGLFVNTVTTSGFMALNVRMMKWNKCRRKQSSVNVGYCMNIRLEGPRKNMKLDFQDMRQECYALSLDIRFYSWHICCLFSIDFPIVVLWCFPMHHILLILHHTLSSAKSDTSADEGLSVQGCSVLEEFVSVSCTGHIP
jgi:hypothetical protein